MLNKIKSVAIAVTIIAGGIGVIHHMNKPLEYDFSSVYDGNKHHALVYADGSKRYSTRCAEELADNFIKAGLGSFDITVVDDGEYTLVFYNSEKIK